MTCTLARKRKNYHLERIGSGFCFSMQPKVHLAFARRAFGIFNCNCLRLWKLIFIILAGLGKHLRTPARIAPCCYQSYSVARKLSFPDFTLDHVATVALKWRLGLVLEFRSSFRGWTAILQNEKSRNKHPLAARSSMTV
jgi:hypothetical protein